MTAHKWDFLGGGRQRGSYDAPRFDLHGRWTTGAAGATSAAHSVVVHRCRVLARLPYPPSALCPWQYYPAHSPNPTAQRFAANGAPLKRAFYSKRGTMRGVLFRHVFGRPSVRLRPLAADDISKDSPPVSSLESSTSK